MRAISFAALVSAVAIPAWGWAAGGSEGPPRGTPGPRALFALIVGVNDSLHRDRAPLQYADDDAARYQDLFRALGARTYLLSRLDRSTRALHPQAAAEALPPRLRELALAVDALTADVGRARAQGVKATLYVVYAGHGEARDSSWHLTLEDGALGEAQLLSDVVGRARADESHLIIDACNAHLLAQPRGPGGTRRPASGFVALQAASRAGNVGFLLSTSVSGDTHEWAGFEAGVFSHAVRSGLYGAADADGDRRVTYAEIASFVHRASEAITNERFRPRVLAHPPSGNQLLLDLGPRRSSELRFEGPERAAHHLLEDGQGIRILDFHGSASAPVHLIRPAGEGPLYLRRVSDGTERTVPRGEAAVQLDSLPAMPARSRPRGAAHDAFGKLFALGFDRQVVERWAATEAELFGRIERERDDAEDRARQERLRALAGWTALGVGALGAASAVGLEIAAYRLRSSGDPLETHRQATERNDRIDDLNRLAIACAVGAAASAGVGALLLLWPSRKADAVDVEIAAAPSSAAIRARWRF